MTQIRMKMPFAIQILVALLLISSLSSCSSFKFVYTKLDWGMNYYVNRYVSLSEEQNEHLDKHAAKLLSWHCDTQISLYSEYLAWLKTQAQQGAINQDTLAESNKKVGVFFDNLSKQAFPSIVKLLREIEPAQIDELMDNISDSNNEFKEDYVDVSEEELREELDKNMRERIESWLGELSQSQVQLINQWSAHMAAQRDWQAMRLQSRQRWQQRLGAMLQDTSLSQDDFTQQLHVLVREPQSLWDKTYTARFEQNRDAVMKLIGQVSNTVDKKQKAHFVEKITEWMDKLNELECAKSKSSATLAAR